MNKVFPMLATPAVKPTAPPQVVTLGQSATKATQGGSGKIVEYWPGGHGSYS
ncbi:acinetodin/klebsidin/J25 family lasso peptide [Cupriavidus pauculus]|uniref:Acinetodin/klebsidin/J25 family lasso peptide n=1 Tax=Cupriavidus pauculus TaxID=82633 RepID=A0A2N5C6T5_9BURK|nr:acinetodin/klebsidin/J25 family lasso peptide [Cupriavidus pauculus]PLP97918.1 acinetodin/klebsidin/J25 family lasso peptide [Cupriavidus pauculus]